MTSYSHLSGFYHIPSINYLEESFNDFFAFSLINESYLCASSENSSGGKKADTSKEESEENDAPVISERSELKRNPKADISNNKQEPNKDETITNPHSDLTGDTGNLNIGQTDLGASGTGAENL